jgi:hypothetical protein
LDGVIGRLEVGDLEAKVLCAEVFLSAESHWEGDPTQGVGRLAGHDTEERLVALLSLLKSKSIFFKVSTKMMLSPLPPSMRV